MPRSSVTRPRASSRTGGRVGNALHEGGVDLDVVQAQRMQPRQFAQPRAGMFEAEAHAQAAPARGGLGSTLWLQRRGFGNVDPQPGRSAVRASSSRCTSCRRSPALASEAAARLTQRGRPSRPMAGQRQIQCLQVQPRPPAGSARPSPARAPPARRARRARSCRCSGQSRCSSPPVAVTHLEFGQPRMRQAAAPATAARAIRARPAPRRHRRRQGVHRQREGAGAFRPAPVRHRPGDRAACACRASGSSAPPMASWASGSTVASAARKASSSERAVSSAMPAAGRYSAKSEPLSRPASAACTRRG